MIVLKLLCVPLAALAAGLIVGIAPCYVFPPLFAGAAQVFCGFKNAPPYFELQFAIGAAAGAALSVWLLFLRRRA